MRWLPVTLLLCASSLGCEQPAAGCGSDSDCDASQACIAGGCEAAVATCLTDADCGEGALCRGNICEPGLQTGDGDGDGDAPTRVLSFAPSEIDFGSPILGVSATRSVTVENVSSTPFEITGAALDVTTSELVLSSAPTLPITLAPGDSATFTVEYTLADGEADAGELHITTSAEACAPACAEPTHLVIPVTSAFAGSPQLDVAPLSYDFGYTAPGASSAVKTVVITNNGSGDHVLTVTDISVAGDTGAFVVEPPTLPTFVAPGESVDVLVTYTPADEASHLVSLAVTANSDAGEAFSIASSLSGVSLSQKSLVWTPSELVFPTLEVGTSAQLAAELQNIGGSPIEVADLVLGAQTVIEYSLVAYDDGAQVVFPRTVFPGEALTVYVDYVAQTGEPSATAVAALNDQPGGDIPILLVQGESYEQPGGAVVEVVSSPVTQLDAGCGCQALENVPAANVDLSYRAQAGATCAKPANPACGTSGMNCACDAMDAYGDVAWGGARVEEVRGETWIIDEGVAHSGAGDDGTFTVRTDLLDDCLAVPGSTDYATNHACCMWVDCEEGPQACYPYSEYPSCANECQYYASVSTSQDCLARGPVAVRTTVTIKEADGTVYEARAFCQVHSASGAGGDVVALTRLGGAFTFDDIAADVVEVDLSEPCPQP